MKRSFATTSAAVAEPEATPAPAVDQAPAVVAPKTLALPSKFTDMEGTWEPTDVRYPRINIVQKTSADELVENFGLGSIVLNKEVKIGDKDNPVRLTALRTIKDYQQKLDFDSGETPQVYRTPEEVEAAGGSLNYRDYNSGNFYQTRAHIQFAIQAPEGLDETQLALFPYEHNGKAYAIAIMTVASSAFTSLYKELATYRTSNKVMRNGLVNGKLELGVQLKKKEAKSWYVPTVKFTGANDAEIVEFFQSIQ